VRPCELTRTVAPSEELEAVLTSDTATPPLAGAAAGALAADALLDVRLELLPHAASSNAVESEGRRNFAI